MVQAAKTSPPPRASASVHQDGTAELLGAGARPPPAARRGPWRGCWGAGGGEHDGEHLEPTLERHHRCRAAVAVVCTVASRPRGCRCRRLDPAATDLRCLCPHRRDVDSRGLRRLAVAALPFAAATIPIHCGSRRRFYLPVLRKRRGRKSRGRGEERGRRDNRD
uniref:Uncharacterized protein n=1 Tax=Oryza rufipogon TaxID=4529 RepID=A0A0E0NQW2_ORYRU